MMLTTSDRSNDVERAYELGASGYVVKSSDTSEMIETLRQLQLSFSSFNRLPERKSSVEPAARLNAEPEQASDVNMQSLQTILESDADSALRLLVAAYRKDRDEAAHMLKAVERASTTRFAALVSRFCLEQRHFFAGGREVDWSFLRRIVMDKLPRYEDPERVAGIVANISAVLETNEWASGDDPACQAWRGFSAAYLNQRWQATPKSTQATSEVLAQPAAPWNIPAIATLIALVASVAGFIIALVV